MRYLVAIALLLTAATAHADTRSRTVTVTRSAQDDACEMARTGILRHRGGNGWEGVGYSSRCSSDAISHCCFWGKRKVKEIGVARGPRGWFACVRYW
jgi:hypothetical protein